LQNYRIRDRLLRSTNDSLAKAFESVRHHDYCRPALEECREHLRKIREFICTSNSEQLTREHYEDIIEQLRKSYEIEKCKLKDHFEKEIDNAKIHAKHQIEE
jgi:hypothetical protein